MFVASKRRAFGKEEVFKTAEYSSFRSH